MTRRRKIDWIAAILAVPAGLLIHFWFLRLADRADAFPSIHDPILKFLPTLRLDVLGEIAFVGIVLIFCLYHFRQQSSRTMPLLFAIGLLYAARGVFLWLLPIGAPPGAPTDVLQIYPFPSHSYFPGGHVGLISLFGWMCQDRRWRWGFVVGAVLFGFGSMLAKAHYTADVLGGLLLSWAVYGLVKSASRRGAKESMVSS